MNKTNPLAAALRPLDRRVASAPPADGPAEPAVSTRRGPPAVEVRRADVSTSPASGGQPAKKQIAGHFDPAVSRQLRQIAVAEDSSVQQLLAEALNELFTRRGLPPIA